MKDVDEEAAQMPLILISRTGYTPLLLNADRKEIKRMIDNEHVPPYCIGYVHDGERMMVQEDKILLLNALWSYIYMHRDPLNNTEFRFGLSKFAAAVGKNARGNRRYDFVKKIKDLANIQYFSIDSYPGHLSFHAEGNVVDKIELLSDESLVIHSEYFQKVFLAVYALNAENSRGRFSYWYTDLVHANILSRRNKSAALAVMYIIVQLVQMGNVPANSPAGAVKRGFISLEALIAKLPILKGYLENSLDSTSVKNRKIRRFLDQIKKIIDKDTDVELWYQRMNLIMPKYTNEPGKLHKIVIEHSGRVKRNS